MLKQTIVWTALPRGADDPLVPGGSVRLSVFVAPRLWNDQPIAKMKLSQFPDFLDWPDVIRNSTFEVVFEGGPTVTAAVDSPAPDSTLWGALFKTGTDVIPFEFEDLSGAQIMSFSAVDAHDAVVGVYVNAATNSGYGAGSHLPSTDDLAGDKDLDDIRRPVRPEPPFVPDDPDRGPVVVDTPGPIPPKPPKAPWKGLGCLLWLLLLPFKVLWWLIKKVLKLLGFPVILALLPFLAMTAIGIRLSPSGGGGGGSGGGGGAASAKKQALDDIRDFVAPTSETPQDLPSQAEIDETYDFHKMIAALGDYPPLLRRMGLVVDLAVPVPAGGFPATGTVKVVPKLPASVTATNFTPRTHYELGVGRFLAQPRLPGQDLANGLLRLQDTSRFAVHQIDVAGSAVKLQNTATNIVGVRELGTEPVNGPDEQGLPALQTAGISIVRPNVRSRLREIFLRMYALNRHLRQEEGSPFLALASGEPSPAAADDAFAEDLVRGYRIDVRDDQALGWLSLCRRVGSYHFLDLAGPAGELDLEDEGFVQMGATETIRRASVRTLRAHETVFSWEGWSLAAPRPGDAILPTMAPNDAARPPEAFPDGVPQHGVVPNTAATPFRLEVMFTAKAGSLPRLRYGHKYRVRARMVDLAGNSVFEPGDPAFDADETEITDQFMFRRFEPVSPPPVMLREVPKEGESLERLTVRSAVDDSDPQVRAQATERHLAPPKVAQLLAERHARFDGPTTMSSSSATYDLASREAGSLTHRLDLATNESKQIVGVKEVEDAALHRTYWLQELDTFDVSYLPDPYARGVLLRGLPGMAGPDDIQDGVNRLPFAGTWPDLKPMRLRLTGLPANEAPPAPIWDATDRVLTVKLAQGETATVLIASYFHEPDLDTMGIWEWTEQAAPPDLASLRTATIEGRNWLHLPYRTLTLVHAVQQPLTVPAIASFDPPQRDPGDTTVILNGTLAVDGKSTGKVDVSATWSDPVDIPGTAAVTSSDQTMPVRDLILPDPASNSPTLLEAVTGMQDAKAGGPPPTGLQHTIGDTKYHRVSYSLVGTTRFREHFPAAIVADPKNLIQPRPGQLPIPLELDVPSSARPAAPQVAYALPTFNWTETDAGTTRTRIRRGGGIRVYLERGWFSSGAGELLGVVVGPPNDPLMGKEAEALRKYTSEWGMDPLWASTQTLPVSIADFVNATETGSGLALLELAEPKVEAAGFVPVLDAARDLWFADIEMNVEKVYFPFVRLAFARFQPKSIDGVHLSAVSLGDYLQVAPHRKATYDLGVGAGGTLNVSLEGPGHAFGDFAENGTTVVVARLEVREHGDAAVDEPLGWTAIESEFMERKSASVDNIRWEHPFTLPNPLPKPLRVSILEAQVLRADGTNQRSELMTHLQREGTDAVGAAHIAGTVGGERENYGYRVVFADTTVVAS
jgi:hypothetical protein